MNSKLLYILLCATITGESCAMFPQPPKHIMEHQMDPDLANKFVDFMKKVANSMAAGETSEEMKKGAAEFVRVMSNGFTEGFGEFLNENSADMEKTSHALVSTIINSKNVLRVGLGLGVCFAIYATGLYGTKAFWEYVGYKLTHKRPKVLLPGAKLGWYDRWSRYWAGYKTPEMIFTETVKARLHEIVEKTKNIKKHIKAGKKATYDNLLLYGEPGTGKTLFATLLADLTDMDFAATTAGALLQKDAGVKYLNELIDMANRSKYGVILFIDEADALFVDRNSLDPASEHYQVLNHLLALTGDGSNKFMLIAATNHAYVMDEAMGRRFQDRVHMPLPDASTRKQIIELYAHSVLYNSKNNGALFVEKIKQLFTTTVVQEFVEKTDGLSNAEIKDIVCAIHKKSIATQNGMPTRAIITSALEEGIEKKQALLADRAARDAKTAHKTSVTVAAS